MLKIKCVEQLFKIELVFLIFLFIFIYLLMRNCKDFRNVNKDYDVIIVFDFFKYFVKNVRYFLKLFLFDFNF